MYVIWRLCILTRHRVYPNVARNELGRLFQISPCLSYISHTITLSWKLHCISMQSQERYKSTEGNSAVSSHACLLLPHHTSASRLAEECFESWSELSPHENENQVWVSSIKYKSFKHDILRKCYYSIIYEWSDLKRVKLDIHGGQLINCYLIAI